MPERTICGERCCTDQQSLGSNHGISRRRLGNRWACKYKRRHCRRFAERTLVKTPPKQKTLALDSFNALFNKRDYEAAKHFWSPNYAQHSAHIPPGRDGLFDLVRSLPPTLKYEHDLIVAEG